MSRGIENIVDVLKGSEQNTNFRNTDQKYFSHFHEGVFDMLNPNLFDGALSRMHNC